MWSGKEFWLVEGGMHKIAEALATLAAAKSANFLYGAEVSEIIVGQAGAAGVRLMNGNQLECDAVVVNADVAAISSGRLGDGIASAAPKIPRPDRSLSAITWNLTAETEGFPLLRHTVFFSNDYAAEFDDIFHRGRIPKTPTVYVCAQDRDATLNAGFHASERLFCLVNAPPTADSRPLSQPEIDECELRTFRHLETCGLRVRRRAELTIVTTPADFERLFPATGGALYGTTSHGWRASFRRPGSRSRIPGLYLAGGSTHPGPGVPMAALSGRLAASSVIEDWISRSRSRPAAMSGGTSMR